MGNRELMDPYVPSVRRLRDLNNWLMTTTVLTRNMYSKLYQEWSYTSHNYLFYSKRYRGLTVILKQYSALPSF